MSITFGDDFAEDVKINRFKLDEDCELQPSLYHYYAEEQANARAERDACKDKLELILGQREIYIRRNPPDDMKVTEAVVTALLVQDTEVLTAREALRKAQAKVDILYAATTALDHRKGMLDNLVSMWSKDYYNGVRKDGSDEVRRGLNEKKGRDE